MRGINDNLSHTGNLSMGYLTAVTKLTTLKENYRFIYDLAKLAGKENCGGGNFFLTFTGNPIEPAS